MSMPNGEHARQANLLGALALAIAERVEAATQEAAGQGGSAPAALAALSEFLDGASIDTLRRPLRLTHSAAVRLTDRLADAGLVRREPGADARSVSIRLTPEGRRAAARVMAEREEALRAVLEPLDGGDRIALASVSEKLLAGLTTGRSAARHICRMCDGDACGHPQGRCPVTRAADRAESAAA